MHGASCSAHVFHKKQHARRMFVRKITTHPNPGPTPPHSRLGDPDSELLQQRLYLHCTSSTCFRLHTIELLNTSVRRPSLSLLAMIHPNSVVIEFGSESAWQRTSGSESAWQRTSLSSESKNSSHRIRVRVGGPAYPPSKSSRHGIQFVWQPAGESVIHRNDDGI